ncbi:hypothetical protein NB693_23080 [Pantoea ananatis]|uniref:hypothetical protein n=1 Tax=Pantoea ananas TaxID=553 RepID=UPI00222020D0|nr:hypothetical protein [Pantoea ananatis]
MVPLFALIQSRTPKAELSRVIAVLAAAIPGIFNRAKSGPVVPMALRNMWTSMWSKRDSRLRRMRAPTPGPATRCW